MPSETPAPVVEQAKPIPTSTDIKQEDKPVDHKSESESIVDERASTPEQVPKKPKPLTSIPSIGRIGDLRKEVERELQHKEAQKDELSTEIVRKYWSTYADAHESNGVKNALKNAEVVLIVDPMTDIQRIKVNVGTSMARETVVHEQALLQFIREKTAYNDLTLEVVIDTRLAPVDQTPKLQTKEDIYLQMKEENPLIDELIQRLELKIKS